MISSSTWLNFVINYHFISTIFSLLDMYDIGTYTFFGKEIQIQGLVELMRTEMQSDTTTPIQPLLSLLVCWGTFSFRNRKMVQCMRNTTQSRYEIWRFMWCVKMCKKRHLKSSCSLYIFTGFTWPRFWLFTVSWTTSLLVVWLQEWTDIYKRRKTVCRNTYNLIICK